MNYLAYCKKKDQELDWDRRRYELDYLGSYTDNERALKSMKQIENKFKDQSGVDESTGIDLKDYYDPTPPKIVMTEDQQKAFEQAMGAKFGGQNNLDSFINKSDGALDDETLEDYDDINIIS